VPNEWDRRHSQHLRLERFQSLGVLYLGDKKIQERGLSDTSTIINRILFASQRLIRGWSDGRVEDLKRRTLGININQKLSIAMAGGDL